MESIIINVPQISEIVLTTSDIIELFGIAASLLVSIIAVIISVISLHQNSKMIEEASRPQIQIYPVFIDSILYLVIKNYGASEAYIDEIKCSHIFTPDETMGDDLGGNIFAKLSGAIISSGHSIKCPLYGYKVKNEIFNFEIKYHSSAKKYKSAFSFNPISNLPFADMKPHGNNADDHLKNISMELYNIVKLKL